MSRHINLLTELFRIQLNMKKIFLIAGVSLLLLGGLSSCGKKSEANREQIENARDEANEMLKGYDPSKSMNPTVDSAAAQAEGKVTYDTSTTTEIIVSEEPAPQP